MPTLVNRGKEWIPKRKKQNKSWSFDERYHTTKWRKYRKSFLKDNPLCVECRKVDKIKAAKVVGHIIPVSQQPELFWDTNNHKALCTSCNNRQSIKDRQK